MTTWLIYQKKFFGATSMTFPFMFNDPVFESFAGG